jgi:hypothetical protein
MEHYFEIIGDNKYGIYNIFEYRTSKYDVCHTITGNKRNGVQQARIWIGEYLLSIYGEDSNERFIHYCIKPGRDMKLNKKYEWTIKEYLHGLEPIYPSKRYNSIRIALLRESLIRARDI